MEIKAFKAMRFNADVVGDVGSCIAPPYDVISPGQQDQLYEKSEYNIVRIIKPKASETDTLKENRYTRAAEFMKGWIEKGALKTDAAEAIYAYVQDFDLRGQSFQRTGFVALGKLSNFGDTVRPHEKTLDGPKADRLNLMRATATQFGQIFVLYDDAAKIADGIIASATGGEPLVDFDDDNGVRHRLFAIDESADTEAIIKMMADKEIIIADGHHRYETALNYYNQTQNPAAEYRMMTFVNVQNEGLVILPTHRLVSNVEGFDIEALIANLKDNFEVTEFAFADADEKQGAEKQMFDKLAGEFDAENNAFGIYGKNNKFYIAVLKDDRIMDQAAAGLSGESRRLDALVLHRLILEEAFGIGEKQLVSQSNIEYIKDIGEAIAESIGRIDSSQCQAVFFMNPTRIEQVQAVAAAGEKMPQKSTFFYPKIYTGLTINKL